MYTNFTVFVEGQPIMGSRNESEIFNVMLDKSTYLIMSLDFIVTSPGAFTKCSVEFEFLATVQRICLAMAAGALMYIRNSQDALSERAFLNRRWPRSLCELLYKER